ncbi:MAG: leucine-rich repeat domain-containing protein [Christensenella sp.]|nr:leucine-rich repeat domain-containing protein [Christensenella sp.]
MKRLFCCLTAAVLMLGVSACAATAPVMPDASPDVEPVVTEAPRSAEGTGARGEVIDFNDRVLEGLVRETMNQPTGDITAADALGVTVLDFQMQGVDPDQPYIHSLDALKYFTNLTYLGLGFAVQNEQDPDAPIDISPLAEMTKLTSLQLGGLVIDDLSVVANMPNLESLTLFGGNRLTDLSPVAGLSKLTALTLRGNQISDISPLEGLTNLAYLDLQDNRIADVSPIAGLTNLTRLFIDGNPISNVSALAEVRSDLEEWDFETTRQPG